MRVLVGASLLLAALCVPANALAQAHPPVVDCSKPTVHLQTENHSPDLVKFRVYRTGDNNYIRDIWLEELHYSQIELIGGDAFNESIYWLRRHPDAPDHVPIYIRFAVRDWCGERSFIVEGQQPSPTPMPTPTRQQVNEHGPTTRERAINTPEPVKQGRNP